MQTLKRQEEEKANQGFISKVLPGARDISYVKKKFNSGVQGAYEMAPGARDLSLVKKKAKGGVSAAYEYGAGWF